MTELTRLNGPVFVVGAMRSGTTLMRLMLNRHSTLAIPPESHFVSKLFRRFAPDTVLDAAALDEALRIVTTVPEWQKDWRGDAASLRARLAGRAPIALATFIAEVFIEQTAPTGKPRWGDKTPAYLFQLERLRQCFPDARFVAMVRDPRDAYLSLAPRDWVGRTSWRVGKYLERCDRLVAEHATRLPEAVTVVRYEDVVLDPEGTLRRVCAFLDLEFEPAMLAFHLDAADHLRQWELDVGAHNKLLRPMTAADVARWRHEGSRAELREVEAITWEATARFGYERTVGRALVPFLKARARLRNRLMRRSNRRNASERPADAQPWRVP